MTYNANLSGEKYIAFNIILNNGKGITKAAAELYIRKTKEGIYDSDHKGI